MSKEIALILQSLERTAYRGMPVQPAEVVNVSRLAKSQQIGRFGKWHSWQLVLDVRLAVRRTGTDTWHFDTHDGAIRAYKRVLRRLYQSRKLQSWQIRMERKAVGNMVSVIHQEEGP